MHAHWSNEVIEIKLKITKDKKQKSTTKTMHRNFLGDALFSELGDASRLQCKVLCRKIHWRSGDALEVALLDALVDAHYDKL